MRLATAVDYTVRVHLRPAALALVVCALFAAGCSSTGSASTVGDEALTTGGAARPYKPVWTEGPCPVDVPDGAKVTCGTLKVPENRADPGGNLVTLPVVRIHSTSSDPAPDPVVYLHGGPGIGTLANGIGTRVDNEILARRDLILFDQRGTGLADPSLECPEREQAFLTALGQARPFADELADFDDAIAKCFDRLTAAGHDLDQYDTANDAADLADLRIALGLDEWNLWGVSYGTRLALDEMRMFPDGIRSVVLDSVYPPSAGAADDTVKSGLRAFDALSNGCGTDPACHARYPDVRGDLDKVAADLDASPYAFDYTDDAGATHHLLLTGNDAVAGLFNAMYDTSLIPELPSVIHDMANGGRALVPLIAQMGVPFVNDTTEGAYLSYECADNGARLDPAVVARLRRNPGRAGLLLLVGYNLFCDEWPVRHESTTFGNVVKSDIPTLVFAGEYDPITPPATSKAVADTLSDSVFVQVPHGGHGVGRTNPCTTGIFTNFWDDGTKVDTTGVGSIQPMPFS